MLTLQEQALADWVRAHAGAADHKLYFTINGDVPLTLREGQAVFYEIPHRGKRVCVLHPEHLTQVARVCYEQGVQMVQVQM